MISRTLAKSAFKLVVCRLIVISSLYSYLALRLERLFLISPHGSNEFFTVFAKVVSQRFTNKKGNNRLPYLSFPYPISPNNPYTLLCKKNRQYLQTFASSKECLNRFLQMRLQRYKIIFNPPNKIAILNIFLFKVLKILAGGSVIVWRMFGILCLLVTVFLNYWTAHLLRR